MPVFVFDIRSKRISTRTEVLATPVTVQATGTAAGRSSATGVVNTNGKVWARGQSTNTATVTGVSQARFSGAVRAVGQAAGAAYVYGRTTSQRVLSAVGAASGAATVSGVGVAAQYGTRSAVGNAAGRATVSGASFRVPADPFRSQVVLHLPFDGADGSKVFTDISPSPLAVSQASGFDGCFISQGTKQWGSGALRTRTSTLDPVGALIVADASTLPAGLRLDQADFTVEGWLADSPAANPQLPFGALLSLGNRWYVDGIGQATFGITISLVSGILEVVMGNGKKGFDNTLRAPYAFNKTFRQFAVTWAKATNTASIYMSGELVAQQAFPLAQSPEIPVNAKCLIGASENYFDGVYQRLYAGPFCLDDLRITKGVARTSFDTRYPLPAY